MSPGLLLLDGGIATLQGGLFVDTAGTECCCEPSPTGACCVNSVCHPDQTLAECNALGGTFHPGVSCTPNPCVQCVYCNFGICSGQPNGCPACATSFLANISGNFFAQGTCVATVNYVNVVLNQVSFCQWQSAGSLPGICTPCAGNGSHRFTGIPGASIVLKCADFTAGNCGTPFGNVWQVRLQGSVFHFPGNSTCTGGSANLGTRSVVGCAGNNPVTTCPPVGAYTVVLPNGNLVGAFSISIQPAAPP